MLAFGFFAISPSLATESYPDWNRLEAQRAVYSQALKALRKGQSTRFRQLLPELEGYPLKPFLEYRYLVVRRDRSHDDKIAAFITKHKGSHLARRLRDAWWRALFKRRKYSLLINTYEKQDNVSLQCLYVRSHIRLKRDTEALQPLLHSIWLHGKSRPEICDPLLNWFRKNGLNEDLVWQRIQLSMESRNTRLARYLKRFLPPAKQPWTDLWIQVHRNPQRYLKDRRLKTRNHYSRTIIEYGIKRLSHKRPEIAYQWYEKFRKAKILDPQQVQNLRYHIAMSAASEGLPLAHSLMEGIPRYLRDDKFHHMRLRLALHDRDWPQILESAKTLPPAYPYNRMSLYWKARALEHLGHTAESTKLYKELATYRGYYGFLAAERVNQPHALNYAPAPLGAISAESSDAFTRAREFYRHKDIMNAREEWSDLMSLSGPQLLNHAAVSANQWKWHEAAIRGFGKSQYFDDLKRRFPRAHADLFEEQARRNKLDPALLFAIARRESALATDTRSRAGAIGLMQLMPATARQVAKSLKLKRPRTTSLKKPLLNITLGSHYIASMLKRYDSNPAMALAAYNAGPGAVDRWRPALETDADIWIDTIPFHETRRYVQTVLEYTVIYQWQANRTTSPIWPQIQPIHPPH